MSKRILFMSMISLFVSLSCSISSSGDLSLITPVANETPTPIPEKTIEENSDGVPRIDRAKIASQREIWKSKNIKDYDYILDLDTMNYGIPPQSIEVSVRNGEPVRVRHYRKPRTSRLEIIDFAFTIDSLFDNMESVTYEYPLVYVSFDPDFGFPARADYGGGGMRYVYTLRQFKMKDGKID